jgi:hypothetical protein
VPRTRRSHADGGGHRYGGTSAGVPGPAVSYRDADPQALQRTVSAVTSAGDAITFGRTSEGGAFYVGILSDGLLEKFYLGSPDELAECLESVAVAGESLVE